MTAPLDYPVLAPGVHDANRTRTRGQLVVDLIALTKPRITTMVVITTFGGLWLASHAAAGARASGLEPALDLRVLVATLVGTSAIVAGANALNMYIERDSDALMDRTRNRPLPAGRLGAEAALLLGMVLSAIALPLLAFAVNARTALLAAIAFFSYVLVYTPLKRRTTAALAIGAVPGAIPPLLGWTASAGRIEWPGLVLFGILFFWQLPHFLAIATFRSEDYRRAGLKVLPVERGERVTRWRIVLYSIALVATSLALVPLGIGGAVYLVTAVLLGGLFLGYATVGLRRTSGTSWARTLFLGSIVYLVVLFAALMVGA